MLYGYSEWGFYTTGVIQTIAMEDNIMLCGMQARDLKHWCKQEQKCSSLRSTTSTLYNTNYSNVASKEQLAMLNSVWHKSTIQEVERFHVINIPFLSTEPNSRYVPVLWGLKCLKCVGAARRHRQSDAGTLDTHADGPALVPHCLPPVPACLSGGYASDK